MAVSTTAAVLGSAAIGAAGSAIGGREARKGAERAAQAQEGAAEAGIVEQRAAREAFEQRVQPFVNLGLATRSDLRELLGIGTPMEELDTSRAQRDLDNLIRDRDAAERSVAFWEQKLQADPNNQTAIRNLKEKRQVLAGLPAQIEQAQGRLTQMQGIAQQAEEARALPPAPEAIDLGQLSPGARQLDLGGLPTQAQALDRAALPAQAQALNRAALPAQGQVLDRSQLARAGRVLDASRLPSGGTALDSSQLPSAGTALSPDSFKDNPMLNFVLKEGFRGIREGAAGGGRVPDRDLVEFAQGAASTIIPQLQAQQFRQQQALRSQAIGEQAQRFGQQEALRGRSVGEQAMQFGQQQALRGQSLQELLAQFGQQQALRGQALGEQQAQFGQQQALRGQAIGEQAQQFGQQQALRGQTLQELLQQNQVAEAIRARELGEQAMQFGQLGGLRSQALGERQQQIANLQNLLGLGQASAVGQGQAALSTGTNIGNLLGSIGSAQAAGALGKAQATQDMIGGLAGAAGMGLSAFMPSTTLYPRPTYQDGSAQMGPMMASGRF